MTTFHKNFPFGKGLWIWEIPALLAKYGTLDAIAQKCKDFNISYVMVKAGDGINTWDSQFNPDTIKAFKQMGIKIYGWAYVYGDNPIREADIANWALDLGADGYIFDAEGEWERLNNPTFAATTLLQKVREKHPDSFLAHAPFPIIDSHTAFPYIEFGKYCDAVMPQMYWGTIYSNKLQDPNNPINIINWTYDNWSRWEKAWTDSGHGDSVKPLIPAGQGYDVPAGAKSYQYALTSGDLTNFIGGVKGYKSVNFWSMQHILRDDCWDAIKYAQVDPAPVEVQPVPTSQPIVQPIPAVVPTPQVEPSIAPSTPPTTPLSENGSGGEVTVTEQTQNEPSVQGSAIPQIPQAEANVVSPDSIMKTAPNGTVVVPPIIPAVTTITGHECDKKHIDYVVDILRGIGRILNYKLF